MLMQIAGLEADVVFKNVRQLRLRVCPPDGQIKVSVPVGMSLKDVEGFLDKQQEWITRYQKKIKIRASRPSTQSHTLSEREPHYIWGKQYLINLIPAPNIPAVELKNGWLRLNTPDDSTVEERRKLLEIWERKQLHDAIQPLIIHWEPIMQVGVSSYSIRSMKSRWGSCNIRRHSLSINLELVRRHPVCLEYVLVHEMTHLLEPGHNTRFYAFMNRFLPDWQERESRLNHMPLR
ncbi:MAG: M48 family metallopeptidase [Methylococcaceae bacterium]